MLIILGCILNYVTVILYGFDYSLVSPDTVTKFCRVSIDQERSSEIRIDVESNHIIGDWVEICPQKQSHSAIRQDTDPVARALEEWLIAHARPSIKAIHKIQIKIKK